jgi:hypothetical protein
LLENLSKIGDNLARGVFKAPEELLFQLNPTKMASVCKHPRVRIVSRHDDVEFVECLECGEVFDSEEFSDIQLEEDAPPVTEEDEENA